jgi:hypothetical protein
MNEPAEPDELLDWAERNADPQDEHSMVACGPLLRALARNRDFMLNSLREELRLLAEGKSSSQLSAQAYIHGTRRSDGKHFTIRSVVWAPPARTSARSLALQDRAYSYVTPHDHNFALLTIGYSGPGYETVIYEYDASKVTGFAGEAVDIEFRETLTLAEDRLLYYRPRRDIHIQRYPAELSISLNLIGECASIDSIPQFEFDVENRRIVGLLHENIVRRQLLPFQIAAALGPNESLIEIIADISRKHRSEHIRCAAYRTLAQTPACDTERLIRPGADDVHPLVRSQVRALLENE